MDVPPAGTVSYPEMAAPVQPAWWTSARAVRNTHHRPSEIPLRAFDASAGLSASVPTFSWKGVSLDPSGERDDGALRMILSPP